MMRISWWTCGCLFIFGSFLFPLSFLFQIYIWKKCKRAQTISKSYSLSYSDILGISNKGVSILQALLAGISGGIIMKNTHGDVLHSLDDMSIIYAWLGIPYFIYDTFSMYYVYSSYQRNQTGKIQSILNFIKKYFLIIFHHMIMATVGWTLILFYRDKVESGDYFVGVIYMMEWSTPFVCIRSILSNFKMKDSKWYIWNGIIMMITFPLFRIGTVFYGLFLYTVQNDYSSIVQGFMSVPFGWKIVWTVAVLPQFYWYFTMWVGLVKLFCKKSVKN